MFFFTVLAPGCGTMDTILTSMKDVEVTHLALGVRPSSSHLTGHTGAVDQTSSIGKTRQLIMYNEPDTSV